MQFGKLENSDIEKINTPSSGEISQILENPFIENPSIEKVEQLKCNINPLVRAK